MTKHEIYLEVVDIMIINLGWDEVSVPEFGEVVIDIYQLLRTEDWTELTRFIPEVFN